MMDPDGNNFKQDFAFPLKENRKRWRWIASSETPLILQVLHTSRKVSYMWIAVLLGKTIKLDIVCNICIMVGLISKLLASTLGCAILNCTPAIDDRDSQPLFAPPLMVVDAALTTDYRLVESAVYPLPSQQVVLLMLLPCQTAECDGRSTTFTSVLDQTVLVLPFLVRHKLAPLNLQQIKQA